MFLGLQEYCRETQNHFKPYFYCPVNPVRIQRLLGVVEFKGLANPTQNGHRFLILLLVDVVVRKLIKVARCRGVLHLRPLLGSDVGIVIVVIVRVFKHHSEWVCKTVLWVVIDTDVKCTANFRRGDRLLAALWATHF